MLKLVRTLFICFCLLGIWNSLSYIHFSSTPLSKIQKLKALNPTSQSLQALDKIEWEEDFNDEVSQKIAGTVPTIFYFSKTASVKFKVKSEPFNRIRSFFPPLYLQHGVYRI